MRNLQALAPSVSRGGRSMNYFENMFEKYNRAYFAVWEGLCCRIYHELATFFNIKVSNIQSSSRISVLSYARPEFKVNKCVSVRCM
jgi:hypothetical protein